MGRHKRELRIQVKGVRRKQPDVRRLARAIVRLAIEMEGERNEAQLDHVQALADQLEQDEAGRRTAIKRARSEQHQDNKASTGTTKPDQGAA